MVEIAKVCFMQFRVPWLPQQWKSGLSTSGACRTTATIQIDVEGVISYLSSIMTKALGQTVLRI